MAIVKMKRLRLAAMTGDREELLRLLQSMGCVEISEPPAQGEDPQMAALTRPDGSRLAAARDRQERAGHALEVLKHYAPVKGGLLQPRPTLKEGELLDEGAAQNALAEAEQINAADRRIHAIQAQLSKLASQRAALIPWQELDIPLDVQPTGQVMVQLGTLPAGVLLEQAQGAVRAEGELGELTQASADREQRYLLLVCHSSQADGTLQALKELGWSRANLRDFTGTAKENLERLAQEEQALNRERTELEQSLSGKGGLQAQLRRLWDWAAVEVSREENRCRLLDTRQTFFLEGWVPAERWQELQQALSPYPCAWEVTDPPEEDYPQVPVQLKNNWFTRPLNMVTEMYSLPAYGTLDPNPLMAPFFILFYGIMLADMGYGLLMILASVVVLKRKKPKGTMEHFFGLMGLCGVSTFIMGAITGGFFGDFLPQLAAVINPESTFALPALFTPLDDTMMILVGAMCLGFIQIVTGMAISVAEKLRRGQVMDAVWGEITWWIIFAGLALAILGITPLVLAVGGAMVVAGSLVTGKGIGKITGIVATLYNNVTGYFGDILSYSRLMALMLAGSVIAQVFNTLGAIPGNVVIFLVISLAGNALNFALNLLGCYVHDLRLQCLEFFKTFYVDGGKPFRPLRFNTKYYDVAKS